MIIPDWAAVDTFSLVAQKMNLRRMSAYAGKSSSFGEIYRKAYDILRNHTDDHRQTVFEVVGHAFSHGFHPQHVERLAAYWAELLGGPTTYSDSYGEETTVVKMHSGNGEH